MSRAFVNEDAASEPEPRFTLPDPDSPHFDRAAALALIESANIGNTRSAETATGYRWGQPCLIEHVEAILAEALAAENDRTEQLARRFLRKADELRAAD
ncbi:MAG: hypothetical protein E4H28_01190 [Gemmatimonadales bacterium]|nr:MAG: hypothetical protein E4H28_01190 [Gemmatimonadales bacterium]